jgi:hypothetical protein
MALFIMALSITELRIMTLSILRLSINIVFKMTLSIINLSINSKQYKDFQYDVTPHNDNQ